MASFVEEIIQTWISGGWLMIPLLLLTFFIYYASLVLLFELESHFLIKSRIHMMSDHEISRILNDGPFPINKILSQATNGIGEVKRHFSDLQNQYLHPINRRIRFLSIIISLGPLMGLLGTVTGMLSTFNGMLLGKGDKFQNVANGISEALITTQTGLIISIPAMAILALIMQRRNRFRRSLARLERYNTCLALKLGCPINAQFPPTPNNI